MAKTLIVAGVTALLMTAFGIFWMFMWLVGTNGYSESKGTLILGGNLAMVVLSIILSTVASGWLASRLKARQGWPMWALAPLVVTGVTGVAVVALIIASFVIIALFGQTR